MTGVIAQTFTKVKNFFAGLSLGPDRPRELGQGQDGLINHQAYPPQRNSRFLPFVSSGFALNRKRPAERIIEIELEVTDDEDEIPGSNHRSSVSAGTDWTRPNNFKRFRPLDQGDVFDAEIEINNINCKGMANSNSNNKHYPTRSSGIPPGVEGLAVQPWQFNFRPSRRQQQSKALIELSRGNLLKDTPSTSQESAVRVFENSSNSTQNRGASHSSANAGAMSQGKTDFSTFRFNPPAKEVEEKTSQVNSNELNKAYTSQPKAGPSQPRKSEEFFLKKRLQTPMKAPKRFSNFISTVGKTMGMDSLSNTIRLEEKQSYADLIRRMELFKSKGLGGIALQRSKLSSSDVKAVYKSFPNASPSVSLSFQKRFDRSFAAPPCSSTPNNFRSRNDLKLYSASNESERGTPNSLPSPILIDLEKEDDKDNEIKLKNGPRTSTSFNGLPEVSPHASFADLNDALSNTINNDIGKEEGIDTSRHEESQGAADSKNAGSIDEKDDDDITILSESILRKGRRLNSLALEHSLTPCVNKNWLTDLSKSWREDQQFRNKQIQEELETLDVISKESTLERDLRERMRKKLTLTEIIVLEEPVPTLPEITEEMRKVIDFAKRPGRENEVLAQVFNVDITRGDIKTLAPCKWLNDNVINVYMELIAKRSKEASLPSAHVFSTFFYPKLLKEGYSSTLKRWTRKADIFANDLIIFPIHLGLHWCLACADYRNKTIKYYDSLGGRNDKCLNALLNYLASEMKERKGVILNKDEWELENVSEIPQQQNGSDCGVFSCKFAEYLSRDARLTFEQENMNYYRERMIYEIIKQDLMYP